MTNQRLIATFLLLFLLAGGSFLWHWTTQSQIDSTRKMAKTAILKHDWTDAKQHCTRWLQLQPTSADAILLLARSHSELEEWQQATKALGQMPVEDPRCAAALIEKSEIEWTALNLPFQGCETARQAVKLNPKAIQAHARIIAFYSMTFQRSKMIAALRDAIERQGEPREAYLYLVLADEPVFVNAIDLNSRWLAAEPDSEELRVGLAIQMALHVFLNAAAKAKEETYQQEKDALKRLEEFAEEYPDNRNLLSVLLEHAIEEGNQNRVGRLLQMVPSGPNPDHMIWTAKGWFHLNRNELDASEEAFSKALTLHPCSPRALHEHAGLLRLQGKIEEAEQSQERARIGIALRQKILRLDSARNTNPELLEEIRDYLELCEDQAVANALTSRLAAASGEYNAE